VDNIEFTEMSYDPGEYSLSDEAFETAAIGVYQRVFKNSPYQEDFNYELAEEIVKRIVKSIEDRDTEGFIALDDGMPVAFG